MKAVKNENKTIKTIKLSKSAAANFKEIRTRITNLETAHKAANESMNAFLIGAINMDGAENLTVDWNDDFTELKVSENLENDNNKTASK